MEEEASLGDPEKRSRVAVSLLNANGGRMHERRIFSLTNCTLRLHNKLHPEVAQQTWRHPVPPLGRRLDSLSPCTPTKGEARLHGTQHQDAKGRATAVLPNFSTVKVLLCAARFLLFLFSSIVGATMQVRRARLSLPLASPSGRLGSTPV